MSKLGRIADVGDVIDVEGGTLTVTRMDGRRIDRICFQPAKAADAGAGSIATPAGDAA
jgi:CBS domain containing-hemolysin-like protein